MATDFPITVKTFKGLEEVLAQEMHALGLSGVQPKLRSVVARTDWPGLIKANIWLRSAVSILRPLHHAKATNPEELYARTQDIDWTKYMRTNQTFAIRHTVHSSHFTHSHYAALKVKDAIVDQFQDQFGQRPSIDTKRPHLRIDLHIDRDQVTWSLDSSGEPLFKRGYREITGPAPLNEVLAAGLLLLSGWDKRTPFWDPMCGSGTLPIEAALMAYDLPPQLLRRRYAFQQWPGFPKAVFEREIQHLPEVPEQPSVRIIASDKLFTMIKKSRSNAANLGLDRLIHFRPMSMQEHPPLREPHWIILNPPYDERLPEKDIVAFYREIGDKLKSDCSGSTAWILSASKQALKKIGMRANQKIELKNGPLDSSFREFHLY